MTLELVQFKLIKFELKKKLAFSWNFLFLISLITIEKNFLFHATQMT